jgi:peptidoglycan/LPS O-acetylase OafA/YrhL
VRRFSVKLSNFTQGRDNNFNLIRIIAALAVLITHSFALARGTGAAEPLRDSLGMTMGSIAVDVFFVTSGFLVTASLFTRQSVLEFLWARVLRIFPALLVMLLVTVFGLGLFFTSWPLSSYLIDSQTYGYLLKCATVATGVAYNLPGVFDGNPFKNAVNGSLWSLPYEVRMYAILAVVWAAFRITKKVSIGTFLGPAIVAVAVAAGVVVIARHFYRPPGDQFATLFFMFFSGAALYVLKERITLSRRCFWLFVTALLSSAMVNTHAFFVVYVLTIAYTVLYVAYIPSGVVRTYNQVGDYSYGVYIYAFPVQQSVAALVPGVSVLSLLLISVVVTSLFAALSWHLIERRALGLKARSTCWIGMAQSPRPLFRE